jgi:UDP:flavonoid glycosyltransferase YjiC (YdhE family)
MNSPQLVFAMFPEWFAAPQPDWPANTHAVGFVQFDDAGPGPSFGATGASTGATGASTGASGASGNANLQHAEDFLVAGAPPIVVTPGSAGSTMQSFFRESIEAISRIGARAMLVTNFPEQVPRHLPSGIEVFGYLPFSRLLPRSAMMVYHGGIGTLAQGISAGVPHLVVPHGYDQFDSGWRIEQLGLGNSLSETRYRAARAAAVMQQALQDASLVRRCRQFADRVDPAAALERACGLLESIATPAADAGRVGR